MRSTLAKLVTAAAVAVVPLILQAEPAVAPRAVGQVAPVADDVGAEAGAQLARQQAPATRTRLLFNDPRRRPHAISRVIVANIDHVPRGARIAVSSR